MTVTIPRLVIAGLSGDSGKTVVSLSLLAALRRKGLEVSPFKKGPDYIDAAWLGRLGGRACRNLDTYLVEPEDVLARFVRSSASASSEIAVIEGNRGLFDGKDVEGTHSTAALAKLLGAPVVLVVGAVKATRTVAALVNGCRSFDPEVDLAGVILNKVAGERHESVIRGAIERYCGLPVLGVLPKLGDDSALLPGRHLGLVPPSESDGESGLRERLEGVAGKHLDVEGLIAVARRAKPLPVRGPEPRQSSFARARVGYFRDRVFTFYYPENLEALEAAGAQLVPISSLDDAELPAIDALYIGGGFPETHAERLAQNGSLMASVKKAADRGLPVYAECGGLIYLCRSLAWEGKRHPMAGVFPIDLVMHRKPAGHGYARLRVERPNPFFEVGTAMKGHEFHYSGLDGPLGGGESCMAVELGSGLGEGREGLIHKKTLALYTHIHADSMKDWARNLVAAAAADGRSVA